MKKHFVTKIKNQLKNTPTKLFNKVILAHTSGKYDDDLLEAMNSNGITIDDHHDEIYGKGTILEIEEKAYRIYEDRLSVEKFLYIEE
jgi:hypothetical protein